MNPQPAEFFFDRREWYRLLLLIAALWFVAGLLTGFVGRASWATTLRGSVLLPVIFMPMFWLLGYRHLHRSYVISADGIILRRRGIDLERIALTEIADVSPWPLRITLQSGRRIPFHLMRAEMVKAREALLEVRPVMRDA